jgi:polyribonucleotide nucleotidyltransferase
MPWWRICGPSNVEDDGRINIASSADVVAQRAIAIIQELAATPDAGSRFCSLVDLREVFKIIQVFEAA